MTKETKIGLLVGLAFIILFAIILSEKGAPQRDARSPNFANATHRPAETTSGTTPLQDGGRLAVENQLNPIVQPAQVATNSPLTEEPIVSADAVDEDALPPLPESVVKLLADSGDAGQSSPVAPPSNSVVDTSVALNSDDVGIPSHIETPGPSATPRGVYVPATPNTAVAVRQGSPVIPQDTLIDDRGLVAARTDTVVPTPDRSATVIPAVATNDTPSVIRTTHTVKDGDCVSKIAAEHYGRSTPDRIKLIETANKDVLKQKKGIRVGDKIRIPELAGYEDRFESVAGFTQPRSTVPVNPVAPPADASIVSESRNEFASATPRREIDRVEPFEIKDGAPRVPTAVPEIARPTPSGSLAAVSPGPRDRSTVSDGALVKTELPMRLSKSRWYEVQSGDTLSGIARRELGSERKFKTIYAMNRDVLANKHALKPGTKLRLPPAEDPSLSSSISTGRMSPGTEP